MIILNPNHFFKKYNHYNMCSSLDTHVNNKFIFVMDIKSEDGQYTITLETIEVWHKTCANITQKHSQHRTSKSDALHKYHNS